MSFYITMDVIITVSPSKTAPSKSSFNIQPSFSPKAKFNKKSLLFELPNDIIFQIWIQLVQWKYTKNNLRMNQQKSVYFLEFENSRIDSWDI